MSLIELRKSTAPRHLPGDISVKIGGYAEWQELLWGIISIGTAIYSILIGAFWYCLFFTAFAGICFYKGIATLKKERNAKHAKQLFVRKQPEQKPALNNIDDIIKQIKGGTQ